MKLNDFAPDARDLLKGLEPSAFEHLAIEARREREQDRLASVPTDPRGALQAASDVSRTRFDLEIDSPAWTLVHILDTCTAALDSDAKHDATAEAIQSLLNMACDIARELRDEDEQRRAILHRALRAAPETRK